MENPTSKSNDKEAIDMERKTLCQENIQRNNIFKEEFKRMNFNLKTF